MSHSEIEFKDQVIQLLSTQLKNNLEILESNLTGSNSDNNDNINYKSLYEGVVNTPAYKISLLLISILKKLHLLALFKKIYCFGLVLKRA